METHFAAKSKINSALGQETDAHILISGAPAKGKKTSKKK